MTIRRLRTLVAVVVVSVFVAAIASVPGPRDGQVGGDARIGGPYGNLLAGSDDLGPAQASRVRLTAALLDSSRPRALMAWGASRDLAVQWRPGDSWAVVEGRPAAVADAFGVEVHDYRGRRGQVFYASPQQPSVPTGLRSEVGELGRILGYTPYREAKPWVAPPLKPWVAPPLKPWVAPPLKPWVAPPLEVPERGLSPDALLRTYNIGSLREAGYTGKGVTAVVFAFDGFDQADLDLFSTTYNLPKFTPEVVGGQPAARRGEATMDLEAIHAVAPDARTVLVNARPTVEGDGAYQKIAAMLEDTDRRYPGAVWSFSIGWGCDKLITAADLVPVRAALTRAQANGTSAFDASGDLAGLECKGGDEWSSAPHPDNIGLDAVASMPEMTNVGGTTLSTDSTGGWLAEQAWFDPPLSIGTAGGVSALYKRPAWQGAVMSSRGVGQRLIPDISAVADPFTGVKIVFDQQEVVGGGTSLAAPIWAGITAVMNQYLLERDGQLLGNLNPLLYRISEGARFPAFRDVVLGGNAVDTAGPGYDLVTGLGTPDVDNLVRDLLVAQRVSS